MAVSSMLPSLLFTLIIMVSMADSSNGYVKVQVDGVPDILAMLQSITDTCATTSMAYQESLARNQDIQNMIAETKISDQQILDEMARTLNQSVISQTQTSQTLDKIVGLLSQRENAQTQASQTLADIASTLHRSLDSQHRMEDAVVKMADTQIVMANTLNQVVKLVQSRDGQSEDVSPMMTPTVGQIITQQPTSPQPPPTDCSNLLPQGSHPSGSYTIQPKGYGDKIRVYCDMDTANGGWTVFQRRFNGSVDFYLGWDDYEQGFGDPDGEYWAGLRWIRELTKEGTWTLRIELEDSAGNTSYAEYTSFSVGDADSFYQLDIGEFSGTAGNSLHYHQASAFSTKDNDHSPHGSCAQAYHGAWWYKSCINSNLNALYHGNQYTGVTWFYWKRSWEVLKKTQMKMRRTG